MQNFKTLNLATEFYTQCKTVRLPSHLKSQLLRASSSVALNLMEGRGRSTVRDQKRFFTIAFGSIRECQAVSMLESSSFSKESLQTLDKLAASCFECRLAGSRIASLPAQPLAASDKIKNSPERH